MKFNINFDWAVLTSIFTVFLYWCGYFYNAGCLDFFSYNIEIFDLPVSSLLIQGALFGSKYWMWLTIYLVVFSFLRSFSTKQWAFIVLKCVGLFINLVIILYNISPLYYANKFITRHRPNPSRVVIYIASRIPIFWLIALRYTYLSYKNRIIKKNRKVKIYTYLILKKAKLTTRTIKEELSKSTTTSSITDTMKFEVTSLIHYAILLIILVATLNLFQIGSKLLDKGKQDTAKYFVATMIDYNKRLKNPNIQFKRNENIFPEVEIQGKVSKDKLFLTNTCFKSMCLVTDIHKNVKLYDVKDIKVLNQDL